MEQITAPKMLEEKEIAEEIISELREYGAADKLRQVVTFIGPDCARFFL